MHGKWCESPSQRLWDSYFVIRDMTTSGFMMRLVVLIYLPSYTHIKGVVSTRCYNLIRIYQVRTKIYYVGM